MSNHQPESWHPSRSCVGCALVFGAVAILLGFRLYRAINPADLVSVSIHVTDPSMKDYYLISDTSAGPKEMPWYHVKVTPFTRRSGPFDSLHVYPDEFGRSRKVSVAWIEGKRYGVVVRCKGEKGWRVFWFNPADVHLRWNSWLSGGGEASIELPDKEKGEEYRF